MIIDPWGVILADAGDKPGCYDHEISPARLEQVAVRPSFATSRVCNPG